jgi:hypothetical protein
VDSLIGFEKRKEKKRKTVPYDGQQYRHTHIRAYETGKMGELKYRKGSPYEEIVEHNALNRLLERPGYSEEAKAELQRLQEVLNHMQDNQSIEELREKVNNVLATVGNLKELLNIRAEGQSASASPY